ncbi:MAG: SDR family oxidoreductase [Bacteroidota bacterium]
MKVLLTGSTGYIGRRLLPSLLARGCEIVCLVRDARRFDHEDFSVEEMAQITIFEADLNDTNSLEHLPKDIDAAYYLVHSMTHTNDDFQHLEEVTAQNFAQYVGKTDARQIIYLGGIANDEHLSKHLTSRRNVEELLKSSGVPVTVLRAAIIIGSGSASFEIIRDLTEKLPVMVTPKWVNNMCQPIGIRNVIQYLDGVLLNEACFDDTFDIGGTDVLSYKEMMLRYAKVRGLNRFIMTLPVLTPNLSSHWLYFVTSTSYSLAKSLVRSMKNEVVCKVNSDRIKALIPINLCSYEETLRLAFSKINQKSVISSWKDTVDTSSIDGNFLDYQQVPEFGCLLDKRSVTFDKNVEQVKENIWSIGGDRGWYYGNFLWKIRGLLDKIVGGVGLRRGRRSPLDLKAGDALDFWRVLLADKENKRLLLYAEMKLPGEAWLEFKIVEETFKKELIQTATFRPLGLWGRLYWYSLVPFHNLIFERMARRIVSFKPKLKLREQDENIQFTEEASIANKS